MCLTARRAALAAMASSGTAASPPTLTGATDGHNASGEKEGIHTISGAKRFQSAASTVVMALRVRFRVLTQQQGSS